MSYLYSKDFPGFIRNKNEKNFLNYVNELNAGGFNVCAGGQEDDYSLLGLKASQI